MNYLILRLKLTDCFDFAKSITLPNQLLASFTGCIFRGITLRADVRDLLSHYSSRKKAAHDWRADGYGYVDGYEGKAESVEGISADWQTRTIKLPTGLTQIQRDTIQSTVMPDPAPQTGALTRYRNEWFGKILAAYKNSPTRLIFIEMPRAPLPTPDSTIPARFLDSIKGIKNVDILPADTFRDLEKPEYFADGLHLNRIGRLKFSERLATSVSSILAGH